MAFQRKVTAASAVVVPSIGCAGVAVPWQVCRGLTVTANVAPSVQPPLVTFTVSVAVPAMPAVKVMLPVPMPLSMVPLLIDQLYDAPPNGVATASAAAPERSSAGALMMMAGHVP